MSAETIICHTTTSPAPRSTRSRKRYNHKRCSGHADCTRQRWCVCACVRAHTHTRAHIHSAVRGTRRASAYTDTCASLHTACTSCGPLCALWRIRRCVCAGERVCVCVGSVCVHTRTGAVPHVRRAWILPLRATLQIRARRGARARACVCACERVCVRTQNELRGFENNVGRAYTMTVAKFSDRRDVTDAHYLRDTSTLANRVAELVLQ